MKPEKLANAVTHWLEYERLLSRNHLLGESLLTVPIGQYLYASQSRRVEAERNYPGQSGGNRGRKRQMDFALVARGEQETICHAIESKWITYDRDFKQEVFTDLLRLETMDYTLDQGRWLILAGEKRHIGYSIFGAEANQGEGLPRIVVFADVLPTHIDEKRNVRVDDCAPAIYNFWRTAAQRLDQKELPLSITVSLRGTVTGQADDSYECWIWQIQSVRNRAIRPLR